ncbi:P-loop containing nucleoside triphosphate hydrolase protein, partial [Mycena galopus ATCC 62051]
FRIMGPTGTGKSSFILRLTGDESVVIGHGVESATSEVGQHKYLDEVGRSVTLVDSPGFDDSRDGVTDTDILKRIVEFLHEQYSNDKKLSGVIYFHRITDPRIGGVGVRNLRMFRKLCGDEAMKNVVVVTTRWDDVQTDRGAMEAREKELMDTPGKFFQPLIALGARYLRHDNTDASARRIMKALLENQPIPLKVQAEMREGKTLEETAAGAALGAEMKALIDKHSAEMKELKEEMVKAIAAKDEASKKELEAERLQLQANMTKVQDQAKALADGLAAAKADAAKQQKQADLKSRAEVSVFRSL